MRRATSEPAGSGSMPFWIFARSSSSHTVRRLVTARTARAESASAHFLSMYGSCRCTDLRAAVPLHTGQELNDSCASALHEGLGTCVRRACSFARGRLHRPRYVGYETVNDGYDRIRIRCPAGYETVNDGTDSSSDERLRPNRAWSVLSTAMRVQWDDRSRSALHSHQQEAS